MSNNSLIVTNMKSFMYLCCLVALVEIQVNCWSIDLTWTCAMSSAKSFHNRVLYKIPNNLLAVICHYFTNIYQTCPQLYTGLCDNVHEQCVSAHWNKLTATNIYNHCELKTILVLLWAQFTEIVTWNLIYGPLERNDAYMWNKFWGCGLSVFCLLYWLACQMIVTASNSGLCCCVPCLMVMPTECCQLAYFDS